MSRVISANQDDLKQLSEAVDQTHTQLRHQVDRTKKAGDDLNVAEERVLRFQLDKATYDENAKTSRYKGKTEKSSTAVSEEYYFDSPLHRHRYLLDASLKPARNDSRSLVAVTPQQYPGAVDRKQCSLPSLTGAHFEDANRGQTSNKLPANVQHYYGTEVCRKLFGDDIIPAVQQTNSPQPCQCRDAIAGNNTESGERLVLDPTTPGFQYESLGRILRSNVINGTNVVYQRSVTHDDFRPSVFDGSQQAWLYGSTGKPAIDKYRYRKDDLSRWAEHNIIRTRMMKSMDVGNEKPKKG